MNLNTYQELASRTANTGTYKELLANYSLGIAGEAGEVADLVKKHLFHNHELDKEELFKELGDVLWYLSQIADIAGIRLDVVASKNIEKLAKRYPDGFKDVDSMNREEYNVPVLPGKEKRQEKLNKAIDAYDLIEQNRVADL